MVSGLAVMVLLADILDEKAQADSFTTPLTTEIVASQKATFEQIHKKFRDARKGLKRTLNPWNQKEGGINQNVVKKQEPGKERLGLALLFLGVLAKNG